MNAIYLIMQMEVDIRLVRKMRAMITPQWRRRNLVNKREKYI